MSGWDYLDIFMWCFLLFENHQTNKRYKKLEDKYWLEVLKNK